MLRRVLFCVATALGATLAHAPAASAEDICAYVVITYPVQRPAIGDCVTAYPYDTDCVAFVQELRPTIGAIVLVCVPWTHGELPIGDAPA